MVIQQLRENSKPIAELLQDSVVQIRNAGITGQPGRDTDEVSLDAWLASDEGQSCRRLVEAARTLLAEAHFLSYRASSAPQTA